MANVGDRKYEQDPTAKILRGLSWASWLAEGDSLDGTRPAVWTVPAPLSLVSSTQTPTHTNYMITGGVDGTDYEVTCKVFTVQGEENDASIKIKVREG